MKLSPTFQAFSSLGANDEDIRKKIIETDSIMKHIVSGLQDSYLKVRLAAIRCLHSLSRSVQQLRTTFQVLNFSIFTFQRFLFLLLIRVNPHLFYQVKLKLVKQFTCESVLSMPAKTCTFWSVGMKKKLIKYVDNYVSPIRENILSSHFTDFGQKFSLLSSSLSNLKTCNVIFLMIFF